MDQEIEIEEQSKFDFKGLIRFAKANWYWFIISAVICTGLGFVYLKTKQNVYTRTAQLLIKEEPGLTDGAALSDMAGFDLFNQTSNLYNEINVIQSPDLMAQVVEKLDLNNAYWLKTTLKKVSLYGDSIPVNVAVQAALDDKSFSFRIDVDEDGGLMLSKFKLNGSKVKSDDIEGQFNLPIQTPVGTFTITRTDNYPHRKLPLTILFSHSTVYDCALEYDTKLGVEAINTKSSVMELTIRDTSKQRADDILNSLIEVYNQNWIDDKTLITKSSAEFIKNRLMVLEGELGNVDSDISDFKSSNLLPDLRESSSIYMKQAQEANSDILDLSNQIYVAQYVRNFLKSMNNSQTLPVNSGFESPTIANQIGLYNQKVLERNSLLSVSGPDNPGVIDLDADLANMRTAIDAAIDNHIVTLENKMEGMKRFEGEAVSHIASNPEQAKYLLSVERQQKVKESLYLFLLQKLEENELSQSYTAYNNRVIKAPNGPNKPSSPKKSLILGAAFILGLCIPLAYYFIREKMVTTIRTVKDVEGLSLPFLGEIPQSAPKRGFFSRIFSRGKDDSASTIVVEKGNRNIVNESFRILRTNLAMIIGKGSKKNVVAFTSFNAGAGKSFIAVNLGLTFAFKGERVAIVDCDLRHASTSKYIGNPMEGLSEYLSGQILDYRDILVSYPGSPDLDVIPVGKIPPNPTELLENGRLEQLIEELRDQYDYIFLDCPPIDVVADTSIIDQLSNRTVFVLRAGLFEREMVPELQHLYDDKRYNNMAYIVNGTPTLGTRYSSTRKSYYYSRN